MIVGNLSVASWNEMEVLKRKAMLRKMLENDGIIIAPGVYDALTAKIAERTGFDVVYMSGSCSSACLLGAPDVGLLTMSEMVDNARRIVNAVDIPVIADADNGYGNAINVIRTVREYEKAGVAGIHIEDQRAPKKCGHMEGKQLISTEEMVGKIKAALKAREHDSFLIISRTDARDVLGLEGAIERANMYAKAGADMVYGEALRSREELEIFAKSVHAPLFTDQTEQGKTPLLTSKELEDLGYKIVVFSTAALRASIMALKSLMEELKHSGTQREFMDRMVTRDETYQLLGLPQIRKLEREYLPRELHGNIN